MDDHLAALLLSNDPPSEATIKQVKELLLEPSADLLITDAEIQHLDELIDGLKHKREALKKFINTYNTILSPARRLPADIVHEIFYHCLPTHRNSIMDASEAPMVLTRICSSWRSIAFSSPRIWSKLHVPLPGRLLDNPQFISLEAQDAQRRAFAKMMRLRCQVVREWLERSGECPLSISVLYPSYQPFPDEAEEVNRTCDIFRTILGFARRWRSLELSMPFDVYQRLQAQLSESADGILPMLENFRAEIHEFGRGDDDNQPFTLLSCPQLQRLSLRSTGTTWDFRDLPKVWDRLTYLSFHFFPEVEVLELLAQCHCLVDCRLMIQQRWGQLPRESTLSSVVLPFLRTFSITDGGSNAVLTKAFKALSLPALTSIDYQRPSFHPIGAEDQEHTPFPLFALLENSPVIDRLMLDPMSIGSEDILRCLRIAQYARHLVLGHDEPSPDGRAIYPNHIASRSYADNFDLGNLIISPVSDIICADSDDGGALLPNLENLEAYKISSFSDSNLLCLVSSRLDAWKRGAITSALKHIKVEFSRPKQLPDIEVEISRLAEAAGVRLELNLMYSKPQPRNSKPLSVTFGLMDDGRSWSLDNDGPSLFY